MSLGYLTIFALLFIGLLIVLLAFAAGAAEWWLKFKSSRPEAHSNEASMAPQPGFSDGARRHFVVVWLLFMVLIISVPMAWILFGQAGMPFVRLATMGVLLVCLYTVVALAAMAMASKSSAADGLPRGGPLPDYDPASQADLVARITQRFCPQCRARLAADAPEGLCPACLMAGGLASAASLDPANGMAATTPPSGSQPQTRGEWTDLASHFPQLEILELLGRGGMGAVFKARQRNLDRFVALKVIPPEAAKDPTFAERFAREARALARLNHPNIVTVYDFGQLGDVYYLLMEYVDGVNLRHAQQASRLAPQEALAIVPQICDALQYAHDQGVVHRDIKPENILLDRQGRVKIADFGLAKMLGKGPADFTLTGAQQVMGTPRYMAPEQIEKPTFVDHRADIYSLGVVLYEMLTGELPLGRFEPPSRKIQVDVRIDDVVLRTLEKEPERRYQRASHVKTDLASAASRIAPAWHEHAESARPVWQTPAPPPPKPELTAPSILATAILVAFGMQMGLLLIAAGFASVIYGALAHPIFADKFWGWFAAGFGCLCGGLGCLVGCYTKYQQLAGAVDLAKSPHVTWFDWLQGGQLALGGVFLVFAAVTFSAYNTLTDGAFALLAMGIASAIPPAIILSRRAMMLSAASSATVLPLASSPEPVLPDLSSEVAIILNSLRRLSCSKTDVWVGGVCGGLGECTPIPAWCWRLLFIVLIFGYGVGVVAYVILWICLPQAKGEPQPPPMGGPVSAWLRRMARSRKDVALGGVCGGLGKNTPLPSWCWRVLFIGLIVFYGAGVIPYVLLWICLPEAPRKKHAGKEQPLDLQSNEHVEPRRHPAILIVECIAVSAAIMFAIYFLRPDGRL